MCLISDNIIKNGDIWLEIVNYSKKNLVGRSSVECPNFDHYFIFHAKVEQYEKNNSSTLKT